MKIKDYYELLRVKHYVKNFLVFACLLFSRHFDIYSIISCLIGFICLCFISSSVYIFNDIQDFEQDIKNNLKTNHPIHKNLISIRNSYIITFALLLASTIISLVFLGIKSMFILLIYFTINMTYTKYIKNIPYLELLFFPIFYLLRLIYGAIIINAQISLEIVFFVILTSLFIITQKRINEIKSNIDKISANKYKINNLIVINSISLTLSLVIYLYWLYINFSFINIITLLIIICIFYIIRKINSPSLVEEIVNNYKIIILCFIYLILILLPKQIILDKDIKYLNKLFDKKTIVDIKIELDEDNKEKLYSDVSKEKYVKATIIINGEKYDNVGFRTKGNYIYTVSNPVNNPTYKWGYKLKFDKFVDNQTFHGLTELSLNSNFSDPTYMKEILNYGFFEAMGLKVPYYTFGNMTINDIDFGLITFVENYEISYLERVFNSKNGNLYKPNNEYFENNVVGGSKYLNSRLKFIDYNFDNYSAIFEKTVTKNTTNDVDKKRLIRIIEELNNQNVLHFDINSYITYLAVANSISLLDTYSYSGKNYYIYEENNYLIFLPYDLNMSYVNFVDEPGNSITFDIVLEPFNTNIDECFAPLTCIVKLNQNYYKKYKEEVNKFLKNNILNNKIYKTIDNYEKLIKNYLQNDNYDFNKHEHIESIKYLKMYFKERAKYISSTLNNNDNDYILNTEFIEEKLTKFKKDLYDERNEKCEKNY